MSDYVASARCPQEPSSVETLVYEAISDSSTADFYDISEDGLRNLAMLAARAASRSGWQPIETAPKDGTSILACDARVQDWFLVVGWDDNEGVHPWGWLTADGLTYHDQSLTHWMPLPAPPQALENGAARLADATPTQTQGQRE